MSHMEGKEYPQFVNNKRVKQHLAMRSKRA
ncbi:MAG: hypothetical protein ACRERV_06370 [Methylococcales bacterium]